MKVLLRAPLLTLSGYGIHSRQIFEWLESIPGIQLTTECVPWGKTAWIINQEQDNKIIQRIMNCSKRTEKETNYDYSFQVQLPDEWDPTLAKVNVGVSAFVETDRCSKAWIDNSNKMDAVVVPSTFTKNVAKRSGDLTTPIYVIPEWYNDKIEEVSEDKEYLDIKFKTKFNYLMIGTITSMSPEDDRKNIFYGIKWFCEKFKDDKKVGLVIKTSFGKGTKIDRQLTLGAIKNVLAQVRKGSYPRVYLLHGGMDQEEIARLYKHPKIKCLVSPTRGEGYGLPLIEAAASGLPVIATGWSGHNEFLEKENYLKIDYTLTKINKSRIDNRIFVEDSRWADVSERDFKRKIKELKDRYSLYNKKAEKMQINVCKNFSKKAILEKYNSFFEEIKR